MDATTTRDAAPIRPADPPRRLPPPAPKPTPDSPAPAPATEEGEMPTFAELLELLGAGEAPAPPDWWAGQFAPRQRKLRVRLLRYLAGGQHTTEQLRQRTGGFERAEIDSALAELGAQGVLEA